MRFQVDQVGLLPLSGHLLHTGRVKFPAGDEIRMGIQRKQPKHVDVCHLFIMQPCQQA